MPEKKSGVTSRIIEEVGQFRKASETIRVQIVSYNNAPAVVNVQRFFMQTNQQTGEREEVFGKRPPYSLEVLEWLLPTLTTAKERLEAILHE